MSVTSFHDLLMKLEFIAKRNEMKWNEMKWNKKKNKVKIGFFFFFKFYKKKKKRNFLFILFIILNSFIIYIKYFNIWRIYY